MQNPEYLKRQKEKYTMKNLFYFLIFILTSVISFFQLLMGPSSKREPVIKFYKKNIIRMNVE